MDTDDSGAYVCDICDEQFDSERELQRHVHRVGLVE